MLVRSVIYGVGFDFMHPFQKKAPIERLVLFNFLRRDSNPERVSAEQATVRGTVVRREVRGGYAARTDGAKRHHPSYSARKKHQSKDWCFCFLKNPGCRPAPRI